MALCFWVSINYSFSRNLDFLSLVCLSLLFWFIFRFVRKQSNKTQPERPNSLIYNSTPFSEKERDTATSISAKTVVLQYLITMMALVISNIGIVFTQNWWSRTSLLTKLNEFRGWCTKNNFYIVFAVHTNCSKLDFCFELLTFFWLGYYNIQFHYSHPEFIITFSVTGQFVFAVDFHYYVNYYRSTFFISMWVYCHWKRTYEKGNLSRVN